MVLTNLARPWHLLGSAGEAVDCADAAVSLTNASGDTGARTAAHAVLAQVLAAAPR
ncbi:hypothetical protein ACFPIJ_41030 [Dactylosporangium cerinum]|uniref:Uncharacterized protein n=1 Tax=Dactylosporangium cerinum TaxID=1434730 RepID=A0ABV9W6Q7_9ACTN